MKNQNENKNYYDCSNCTEFMYREWSSRQLAVYGKFYEILCLHLKYTKINFLFEMDVQYLMYIRYAVL